LTIPVNGDIIIKLSDEAGRSGFDFGKSFLEILKKYLTNQNESDIILKLSREDKRSQQKSLKNFKKVLDKLI